MINSKLKGKRGELEFCKVLREAGFDCRRGRQYSGNDESPDVVSEDLSSYHFEIKHCQNIRFYAAMDQAKSDCGAKIPLVAHRKNRGDWHVFMTLADFLKLVSK